MEEKVILASIIQSSIVKKTLAYWEILKLEDDKITYKAKNGKPEKYVATMNSKVALWIDENRLFHCTDEYPILTTVSMTLKGHEVTNISFFEK